MVVGKVVIHNTTLADKVGAPPVSFVGGMVLVGAVMAVVLFLARYWIGKWWSAR